VTATPWMAWWCGMRDMAEAWWCGMRDCKIVFECNRGEVVLVTQARSKVLGDLTIKEYSKNLCG
jgi:hypothetical protein